MGPMAGVTVTAGGVTRVLEIAAGVTTSISGMTFTGGELRANGAGVDNLGAVTLTDCTISGNTASSPKTSVIKKRTHVQFM